MDIFTLSAKLMLDSSSFDRGISDAEKKGSSLASKLSGSVATASKALIAGVTASAGAISALAKQSVDAYSQYQQLVGGVETLFDVGAADVMKNAKEAYRTAGVDMNSYMQTATAFSSALIQGLDGDYKKAAEITDMAIRDMSDNSNKMGTNLESIQNAYQGFAKQNYTMLDNLKLGYGGTKTEMERLLKRASELAKRKLDIKNLADVYEAIHLIQEEIKITGTTTEEAETTIEGSTRMMRSAWQNLKIAFTDPNGNINDAIAKMIDTSKIAIRNVLPAFSNAIKGIGKAVKEIVPIMSAQLPGMFAELLPNLVAGGLSLVSGIVKGIVDNLPLLAGAARQMVDEIIKIFKESDNPVLQLVGQGLEAVETALQWIIDNKETVVTAITAICAAFAVAEIAGLASSFNPVVLAIEGIAAAAVLVISNWESIKADWERLWSDLGQMVQDAWNAVTQFFTNIIGQISTAWGAVSSWFNENVISPISGFFNDLFASMSQIWTGILEAIQTAWGAVSGWVETNVAAPLRSLFDGVKSVIDSIISALEKIFGMGDKDINVNVKYHRTVDGVGATVSEFDNGGEGIEFDDGGGGASHSFAKGSRYVPHDMIARIHRGEEILTPSQARHRNSGVDYAEIGAMIGEAVESAIGRVGVYMSGERVADLTSKRMQGNINANSRAKLRAMGG